MATSKAIEAARAFVKIYADSDALKTGMQSAVNTTKAATTQISAAMRRMADAQTDAKLNEQMAAYGRTISDTGGKAVAVAGRVGSAWGAVTKIVANGISVAAGMLFANSLGGAVASIREWAKSADLIHKASKRTGASADALSQLKFAAEQSGTSIDVVEKSMTKLSQTTSRAASGEKAAADALARVGLSAEAISNLTPDQRLLAVSEAISRLSDPADRARSAMELMAEQGVQLLPMMEQGASGIETMMQKADQLGLTMTDAQVATGAGFNDAIDALTGASSQLAKIIGSAVLPYVTALLNWAIAMAPAVLELGSQIGGYLVQGFQYATNAADKFLNSLGPLWQAVKDTFGGIGKALAAGDIKAAASLWWATMKVEWAYGVKAIGDEWAVWSKAFLDTFAGAMTSLRQMWQSTSNWLAKGIVELMGMLDSSINVEAVQAELELINTQEQQRITREAQQAQAARDSKFEQRITTATADLEAAKKAWAEALAKANTAGERAANEPTAAAVAENKFTQLIRDLKAGDVATRIDQAVGGQGPQDIRSIGGVGQITRFLGGAGELNKMQVQILREVRDVQRQLLTATKADRVGYVV